MRIIKWRKKVDPARFRKMLSMAVRLGRGPDDPAILDAADARATFKANGGHPSRFDASKPVDGGTK